MIDLNKLAEFLAKAKTKTYAGNGKKIKPERPGFKELKFTEGGFDYRDSYSGFFSAPGQEVVRFMGKPVWVMSYSGGMASRFSKDEKFAKQTFYFLKKALLKVEKKKPFRGPENLKEGDYEYRNKAVGDISDFKGEELILFKGNIVFRQNYIGGLVSGK